jgi:hypothetical protein
VTTSSRSNQSRSACISIRARAPSGRVAGRGPKRLLTGTSNPASIGRAMPEALSGWDHAVALVEEFHLGVVADVVVRRNHEEIPGNLEEVMETPRGTGSTRGSPKDPTKRR